MAFVGSKSERLSRLLAKISFLYSPTPSFPLASGKLSNYYVDCKKALSYPEVRELVGELILERIGSTPIDAVGGLALGAYPIAVAVSDAIYKRGGKSVRVFVVRKEPKRHGLKKYIEGDVAAGDRVLIVEDVVTTGGSTVDAILKSREEGLQVVGVVGVIDRQENNGRKNIESHNVPFEALVTLQDLKDAKEISVQGS